ncbi:MAG: PHB depolymerase family esterase [Micropepsaceae bacterium]
MSRMTHAAAAVLAMGLMAGLSYFFLLPEEPGRAQSTRAYDDLQGFSIKHSGIDRNFGLYVPKSYSRERPAPMIIALHGRFSSAKALHAMSHLQRVADARGAILVYPETLGAYWGDGGHTVLQRTEPEPDDMGFIKALAETITTDYAIDQSKVFLLGYDGGGAMAYRLACNPPVRFAAVTVVSALMWNFSASACAAGRPATSILVVHGRDSELFPVDGVSAQPGVSAARLSVGETIGFWRGADGCGASPATTGSDGSVIYSNCQAGSTVAYVGVPGGKQEWAHTGNEYRLNRHEIDTTSLVDRFMFDRAGFGLQTGRGSAEATREHILYVPQSYDARKPTPVVVVLHGRPSNAAAMARISGMNAVAARHGFIVVYPEGLNHEWNAQFDLYNKSAHSVHTAGLEPAGLRQDDVGFLKTLMADLRVDLNVDPQRMYISGFSNGGFMTLRMACSASDTFAGFAEGGSALYTVMTEFCKNGKPAPMFFMHGTADPSILIDGVQTRDSQSGMPTRITLSVKETVALFARRNGCAPSGVMTTFGESGRSPGTKVMRYIPNNCMPTAPIVFYIIEGGGHTWPGTPGVMDEKQFGPTNLDINASDKIWEFLSTQKLAN